MRVDQVRFRAMGTEAHIVVTVADDHHDLLPTGRALVGELEQRWSRFLPTSEITAINRTPGRPVRVSVETVDVVLAAIDAAELTGGRFRPTVGSCLDGLGYDQPFGQGPPDADAPPAFTPAAAADGVAVHAMASTVTVPEGTRLDLGGIGKGAAADLVVRRLLALGATGAMVNLGGDLHADGRSPSPDGWIVELACPGAATTRTIALRSGGVCTSSTTRRSWRRGATRVHHVVDPASGRPRSGATVSATVIGRSAIACEVLATTTIGRDLDDAESWITRHGASGLLVDTDGHVHELDGLDRFVLARPALA